MSKHLSDVVGGTNIVIRGQRVEVAHVLEVARSFAIAEILPGQSDLFRFPQDVVIDVGDILHVGDIPALVAHEADENVKRQKRKGVTDMRRVIRRDPANIETNSIASWRESIDLSRLRVEKSHSPLLRSGRLVGGSYLSTTA